MHRRRFYENDYPPPGPERHPYSNASIFYGIGCAVFGAAAELADPPPVFEKYVYLSAAALVAGGLVMRAIDHALKR